MQQAKFNASAFKLSLIASAIAGMAFSKYGGALNSGGATGFGVRLLNQLIEENYEQ